MRRRDSWRRSAGHWNEMYLRLLTIVALLGATGAQLAPDQTLFGGLAGALINTFLPQLKKPAPLTLNDASVVKVVAAPAAPAAAPIAPKAPASNGGGGGSVALTGVGPLPPVDFPHGSPPTFLGLTNPDQQDAFGLMPSGLQGRTDLPPNYVYPFAPPGAVIRPDLANGEVYSLGPRGGGLSGVESEPSFKTEVVDSSALLQPVAQGVGTLLSAPWLLGAKPPGAAAPPGAPQVQTSIDAVPEIVRKPAAEAAGAPKNPFARVTTTPKPIPTEEPEENLDYDGLSGASETRGTLIQTRPSSKVPSSPPAKSTGASRTTTTTEEPLEEEEETISAKVSSFRTESPVEASAEEDNDGSPEAAPEPRTLSPPPAPTQPQANYGTVCPQCLPVDLRKLAGPWVQVYGNPDSLRNIFGAIMNLQALYNGEVEQPTPMQPACIGMQLSRPQTRQNRSEAALNLYFRDDTINRQLHEMSGMIKQNTNINPRNLIIKLPSFELPVCLVKAGPSTSTMYGYIVLSETLGVNRCRSMHVFARRLDSFFNDYNTGVAEYLKSQVESEWAVQPVSVVPFPELCQLPPRGVGAQ